GGDQGGDAPAVRLGLADADPADGVARQVEGGQVGRVTQAQVVVDAPLDDAEQGLVGPGVGPPAALGPAQGAPGGLPGPLVAGGVLDALVEGHDHVRAELLLDGDGHLRGQAALAAVDVGAEGDPVLVQAAQVGQAEDLEAAGVGQDGAVPAHEAVQAPQ